MEAKGYSFMRQTSSIVLRSVYKEYRRDEFVIPVLADLDLEVAEGEYLAPDGAVGIGQDHAPEPGRGA